MWMMPLHLHVNQKSDYDMMMMIFSIYGLGAQKNHLILMVLLSTHYICFGCEIRKLLSLLCTQRPDLAHKIFGLP